MFLFQVAKEPVARERASGRVVPQPTEVMLRERALNFLDDFVKAVNTSVREATDLLTIAPAFRVTLSASMHRKLARAWNARKETAFLLFEDPKTHVIVEAVENRRQDQGKHSATFEWEFVKKTVTEMRAKGLEFAGTYHSHTAPTEMAGIYGPSYDHSLPSPDDEILFPYTIGGTGGLDKGDPDYSSVVRSNRLLFLGTRKDGAFRVRTFVPINYMLVQDEMRREINIQAPPKLQEAVKEGEEKELFAKHYNPTMHVVEFKLDVERG